MFCWYLLQAFFGFIYTETSLIIVCRSQGGSPQVFHYFTVEFWWVLFISFASWSFATRAVFPFSLRILTCFLISTRPYLMIANFLVYFLNFRFLFWLVYIFQFSMTPLQAKRSLFPLVIFHKYSPNTWVFVLVPQFLQAVEENPKPCLIWLQNRHSF